MSDFFNELKASIEESVQIEQDIKQPTRANQTLTDAMHQHPEQGAKFELQNIPRK